MQGQAEHERVGEGVGDPVQVEQGRHLGLAADAVHPLGDVEHQVPAAAGDQGRGQLAAVADPLGLVAEFSQGSFDGVDGRLLVELGGLLLGIALGQVGGTQVIGQADGQGHGHSPGDADGIGCGRSAPPGSG